MNWLHRDRRDDMYRMRAADPMVGLRQSSFRLTEAGTAKLQQGFSGDVQGRILMALEVAGGSSLDVDEIADRIHCSRRPLERVIPIMVKRGYIAPAGGGYEQ